MDPRQRGPDAPSAGKLSSGSSIDVFGSMDDIGDPVADTLLGFGQEQPSPSPLTLAETAWSNGSVCALSAAFIFAGNALCVKLLGGRVPTSEIVLVRR